MAWNEALRTVVERSPIRTQVRLADEMHVDQKTVSRWYHGAFPGLDKLAHIEDLCGEPRGLILSMAGYVTVPGAAAGEREIGITTNYDQTLRAALSGEKPTDGTPRRRRFEPEADDSQ